MVLPIVGYGHPVLRQKSEPIAADYPDLQELIDNMFETMYHARGVGLAAPQINLPIRIFVVDGEPMDEVREEGEESLKGFKQVFINPEMVEEHGASWTFEEGCLSIPDIREQVRRKGEIILRYRDADFVEHVDRFSGLRARIIQHEYDHLEGVLFTDYISRMRKQIIKSRLNRIAQGQVDVTYPMKFNLKRA